MRQILDNNASYHSLRSRAKIESVNCNLTDTSYWSKISLEHLPDPVWSYGWFSQEYPPMQAIVLILSIIVGSPKITTHQFFGCRQSKLGDNLSLPLSWFCLFLHLPEPAYSDPPQSHILCIGQELRIAFDPIKLIMITSSLELNVGRIDCFNRPRSLSRKGIHLLDLVKRSTAPVFNLARHP